MNQQKIQLVSKSEIRYEGILYQINPEENTVALKNVKMYGTEGRKKDGPQIPPTDQVYEFIVFRGSDIKDLKVFEQTLPHDPAIISSAPASNAPSQRSHPFEKSHQHGRNDDDKKRDEGRQYHRNDVFDRPQSHSNRYGERRQYEDRLGRGSYNSGNSYEYRGNYGRGRGGRGRFSSHHTGTNFEPKNTPGGAPEFEDEFDFSKAVLETKDFDETKKKDEVTVYSKGSSFFDELSCETLERKSGGGRPMDREEREKQRRLDMETFGSVAGGGYGYGGGGRRGFGRGRGGRGGRGRGY